MNAVVHSTANAAAMLCSNANETDIHIRAGIPRPTHFETIAMAVTSK